MRLTPRSAPTEADTGDAAGVAGPAVSPRPCCKEALSPRPFRAVSRDVSATWGWRAWDWGSIPGSWFCLSCNVATFTIANLRSLVWSAWSPAKASFRLQAGEADQLSPCHSFGLTESLTVSKAPGSWRCAARIAPWTPTTMSPRRTSRACP